MLCNTNFTALARGAHEFCFALKVVASGDENALVLKEAACEKVPLKDLQELLANRREEARSM